MGRPILQIHLNDDERQELERRTKRATTPKRDCLRAKIILARAEGLKQEVVATKLGVSQVIVSKWTHRFVNSGMDGFGTVTLFAALNYLEGKNISRTESSHRHVEWLRFLKQIDQQSPQDVDLHLIVDNYSTHKHSKVEKWLHRHPRFKIHFTPTGSSWMNRVERFFGDLTADCIRDGSFTSVKELISSIEAYLAERNLSPRPYKWRAEGAEILKKIQRAREVPNRDTKKE